MLVSADQFVKFVEYWPTTEKVLALELVRTKAERVVTPPVEERTGATEVADGPVAPPIAYSPSSSGVSVCPPLHVAKLTPTAVVVNVAFPGLS